jgi:hypothetical protein
MGRVMRWSMKQNAYPGTFKLDPGVNMHYCAYIHLHQRNNMPRKN